MKRCAIGLLLLLLAACSTTGRYETTPAFTAPDATQRIPGAGQEFALRALSLVGTPYRWGGISPETGFDCSGLVRYVYEQMTGRPLPFNTYGLARIGDTIDARQLQPGDLVFFDTQREPYSHVGIYVGESRFLHAPKSGGRVRISDMTNRYWHTRYNGARRLPI
jgi:cell wall-associated NlpC family hydrolase